MSEDVKTVTIPLDEYFDLRQKAESNMFLMQQLGQFEEQLRQLNMDIGNMHTRVCILEKKR